ncbi:MAG TPA: hypothetical protein VGH89_02965, partial [Pseudonocardia sp.]
MSTPTATVLNQVGSAATAWTTVNNAEALPGLLTPLTWSFWERPIEVGLRAAFADMGVIPRREVRLPGSIDERSSAVFYGRYAGNVDRMRAYADLIPGTSGAALERQIFGSSRPDAPGGPSRRRWPAIAARLPVAAARLPGRLRGTQASVHRWWASETASADSDPARLTALLLAAQRQFERAIRGHILATMLSQAAYQRVCALVGACGEPGGELELTTGYGGLEESLVLGDMWEVSRHRLSLAEFLRRHGYHGPAEGELSSPSWRERPEALHGTVESYTGLDEEQAPALVAERRAATRRRAEAALLTGLGPLGRAQAGAVLRFGARHIPLREVGKATFLRAVDVGRYAGFRLGRHLVAAGQLDDPADAFLLTVPELADPARADIAEVVPVRRALRAEYGRYQLPEVWSGRPEPVLRQANAPALGVGEKLAGLPVCPGVVEGR